MLFKVNWLDIYFYLVFSAFYLCCSFWWFHDLVCKTHHCQCEEYPFVSWNHLYILTIHPCHNGKLFDVWQKKTKKKIRVKRWKEYKQTKISYQYTIDMNTTPIVWMWLFLLLLFCSFLHSNAIWIGTCVHTVRP